MIINPCQLELLELLEGLHQQHPVPLSLSSEIILSPQLPVLPHQLKLGCFTWSSSDLLAPFSVLHTYDSPTAQNLIAAAKNTDRFFYLIVKH